jgi:type I restriction enzyme S subunit
MKNGWRKVKLNEVVEQFRQLYEPVKEENLPYLGLEHIDQQTLSINSIGNSSETQSTKKIFKDGDILFGTLRPYFRKVVKPKFNGVCSTDITVLRAKPEYEQGYLFYFIASEKFIEYATKISYGTKMPRANWEKLSETEWLFPPKPEQKRIASTLSAYDDIIENNTRRIKILEEMVRLIYREWFVEFNAPGIKLRKATPEEKKVTGKDIFPEEWELVRYCDVIESFLGGGWGSENATNEENLPITVIRGTDFNDVLKGTVLRTPQRFITESSLRSRELRSDDIIVENSINAKSRCVGTTLRMTDGILRRIGNSSIAASFCKVFRFKEPLLAPIFMMRMKELYETDRMKFYQNVAANGIGNFQATRFIECESVPLPLDLKQRQDLTKIVSDLTNSTYSDMNFNLRQTRDFLLPKLISGEVAV